MGEATEMAESISPETVDDQAVSRVARVVKIQRVRLLWAHGQLEADPEELPPEWSNAALVGWDSHSTGQDDKGRFRAQTVHFAHYDREWETLPDDTEPKLSMFKRPDDVEIACSFSLEYESEGEIDPDDFRHFAYFNATFNAWPYWREYAQNLSTRMGIEPLVVPLLKVPQLEDVQREDAD